MTIETIPWDVRDSLKTPERQLGYLEAALEDGDPALIAAVLEDIARARGMTGVAQEASITREGLYKRCHSASRAPRTGVCQSVKDE